MTVPTTTNKEIGEGNGIATVFPFTFGTLPTGDLVVTLFDTIGTEIPQVENTDYTVLGKGAEDGGSVVFSVPPPPQYTVLIQRILPTTQPDDLKNQGSYYPRTVERMFDRRAMVDQQLQETLSRTLTLPPQVQGVSTQLPVPEANELIGWDSDGNELRNFAISELATTLAFSNFIADRFTATPGQTNFILTADPGAIGNLDISIDGVTQVPTVDYTYTSGPLVVFATPMSGGESVLIRYGTALPTGITDASAILYTPPSTGILGTMKSFLDALWATGTNAGAKLIRWIQAGLGAVARTIEERLRDTVSVKDFGAIGDGTSHPLSERFGSLAAAQAVYPHATSLADEIDWAAIQAAINFVAPFTYQGGTRLTEENGTGGAVHVPRGIYLCNRKLRLAPSLRLYGDNTANDWTVRSTATGGQFHLGSCIKFTYSNYNDYAVDTSPWTNGGVRLDNTTLQGGDSFGGFRTEVHNIHIENITFYGNWQTKGLNMAGAVKSMLNNVVIFGFTVGARYSATWYASMMDTRIFCNYRGLITYLSVTDLTLRNVSVSKHFEAPVYNPAVNGRESTDPTPNATLSQAIIDRPCGLYNTYSNVVGYNVTVEGITVAFFSVNGVDTFHDIYVEAISDVLVRTQGSDQQTLKYHFDTIVGNTGDVLWSDRSRVEVTCANHNYTQSNFNHLIQYVDITGSREFVPVFRGLYRKPGDTFDERQVRYLQDDYMFGSWTPALMFGAGSAGAHSVAEGRWVKNGRQVTAWFSIQIPTLSGSAGAAVINNLPFTSVNATNFYGGGNLTFWFAYTGISTLNVPQNAAFINVFTANNTHCANGLDLRGVVHYVSAE